MRLDASFPSWSPETIESQDRTGAACTRGPGLHIWHIRRCCDVDQNVTTSPFRTHRLVGTALTGLVVAVVGAGAGGGDGLWILVVLLASLIAWEVLGSPQGPQPQRARSPRMVSLGDGWTLVGSANLAPVYLDALRAWCWAADRWKPMWRPKRGGHKGRPESMRPANPAGSVNRLLATWIDARGSRWTHARLMAAMRELGLLDRFVTGDSFGWSIVPLTAANERLSARLGVHVRKSANE